VAVLAQASLDLLGADGVTIDDDAVLVDPRWMGDDYAVPTREADDAIRWAARTGGWVLDRVYSGKGMAGLLGRAASGEWGTGDDVVFIHTGGLPSVFATDGAP
jgi:1-aminocyclopropane-1-carboxylate deaminase/D-cysteine desulfhydrase-like pyridoxal-dependent ACC family enzyme